MTVQRAYLDYMRLASWHDASALKLTGSLRRSIPKWRTGYWLQYKGWYGDNAFYGIGEQNQKRHYVWRLSGSSSSVLFNISSELNEIYATRLDVQVTIPMPSDYDAFAVYTDQKDLQGRGLTIIESDTGSTIYFGARVSDRFARLYTKSYVKKDPSDKSLDEFLRLEFEFKGRSARALYENMKKSLIGPSGIFQYYLTSFNLMGYIIDWFDTGFDGEELRLEIEKNQNNENKMNWLSSLSNAIAKMGNDHETGEFTRNLLRNWLESIDKNRKLT